MVPRRAHEALICFAAAPIALLRLAPDIPGT